jgi:A/G-specific adenine glycosylase
MSAWPQELLCWYAAHRRALPWRGRPDPYAVWVSEIMLQQTRVRTVGPYFTRFLARFPTVPALAAASPDAVLRCWEGLGYYARARHLQAAAREIVARHAGRLPRTAAELARLPGVGPYTAAAIASICFGERVPVVDGNVIRVGARFLGRRDDFRRPAGRRRLAAWLAPCVAAAPSAGDFNQAMMELGALVCTPRRPDCPACPLRGTCHACRTGTQARFPAHPPRRRLPVRRAVAVIVRRRGRVLLVRRPAEGLLAGFWELPGGPSAAGAAAALKRRTGLLAADGSGLSAPADALLLTHDFSHFRLSLIVYACRAVRGRIRLPVGTYRWASAGDLAHLPVVTLHRRALDRAAAAGP